jgi:hypothetical protein
VADFTLKAHDRLPSIRATLSTDNVPVDLTTATGVKFIMKSATGTGVKVNATAAIVDFSSGIVQYDWIAVDTDTPGSYLGEWQVTWSTGKPQTFPTLSYHTIDILADLDGAP